MQLGRPIAAVGSMGAHRTGFVAVPVAARHTKCADRAVEPTAKVGHTRTDWEMRRQTDSTLSIQRPGLSGE